MKQEILNKIIEKAKTLEKELLPLEVSKNGKEIRQKLWTIGQSEYPESEGMLAYLRILGRYRKERFLLSPLQKLIIK